VLLFTAFWSLKTVHVWVLHHHKQVEHPVCEASHDQNSAHIHDERWAKEDCTLCAFVVSVQAPFSIPSLPDLMVQIPESETPIGYRSPVFIRKSCDAVMRRGPPGA